MICLFKRQKIIRLFAILVWSSLFSTSCFKSRTPKKIEVDNSQGNEKSDGNDDEKVSLKGEKDPYEFGSGETGSEIKYGLSEKKYTEGKTYVEGVSGWDGLSDEHSTSGNWRIRDIANTGLSGQNGNLNQGSGNNGQKISLTTDIAPIIKNNCVTCHSPSGQRPTSPLTNVQEVMSRKDAVVTRVNDGSMPPGGLTAQQKQLFVEWRNEGYLERPASGTGNVNGSGGDSQTTADAVTFNIKAGTQ